MEKEWLQITCLNMVLMMTFPYCASYDSFMKMISLQLPFVYEKPLASTTNFLLSGLILLACRLSGMLPKLATELYVLTFGFLCCVFSGVKENIASKPELGLNGFEHIKSNSQCLAACINLLIRKLINIHFTHWKMHGYFLLTYGNNHIVLVNQKYNFMHITPEV